MAVFLCNCCIYFRMNVTFKIKST